MKTVYEGGLLMEWFKALKDGEFSMPVTFWFCNVGVSFVAYVLFLFNDKIRR